jgi:hypothetical protein
LASLIRLITPVVETPSHALGGYEPRDIVLTDAISLLVRDAARDLAKGIFVETGAELELQAIVTKLEPDSHERPFASAQVVIEVIRGTTRQTVYTRKVESEVRRLLQPPVPMDDPRFTRTALGRATVSCLRSLFTAVADTFGGP